MATGLTFVSYSRTDSDFAVKLASDLRAKGADVWLDQLDIEAGSRWDTAVEGALGRSARLLVLLTPKSVASQNVLDEVSYALDEGKAVLPVLVEPCAIPMRMRRLHYVDFTRGYEAGVARLLTTLGVTQPSTAAAPPAPETPPPTRPARAPKRAAAREREPAAQAEPDVVRLAAANRSRGAPIVPIAAGIALVIAAVAWFSYSPSTVTTSETPSVATAGGAAATPSDPPAATPPTASGTAAASSSVSGLFVGDNTLPATSSPRGDASGDAGLQALLALTRQLGARDALSTPDLAQLADAQGAACPNQPRPSPCASSATSAVQSTLDAVCRRQAGAAPPRSDEGPALLYESKVVSCRQAYLSLLLSHLDLQAKEAIRKIKEGG